MMTKLSTLKIGVFLAALLAGFFATNFITSIEAQVMTNRTPDKAKIQPKSDSNSTIMADPVLSVPGTTPPQTPKFEATMAYVWLAGVNRVSVSDAKGRTDEPFKAGTRQQVDDATYHLLGSQTIDIVVPVGDTYTITFETDDPAMLQIIKGRGDVSPEEAVRYNDLVLNNGTARFQLSATGVSPVRLDANGDGRFETILEPTAHVRGLAAKDKRGPEITFEVLQRDANTILVAIKAVDKETGVKSIFYSIDGKYDSPYKEPVRVDLKHSTFIYGFADDSAGNRSFENYEFGKHR
jgi:hypothetical protein